MHGVFRMFQNASEQPGVRVFRDRREAERWLAEDGSAAG